MGPSSILRGKFSVRDIQRVPVPLSLGQCVRAQARVPVLCNHLSPAAALCYLVQEGGGVIKQCKF